MAPAAADHPEPERPQWHAEQEEAAGGDGQAPRDGHDRVAIGSARVRSTRGA